MRLGTAGMNGDSVAVIERDGRLFPLPGGVTLAELIESEPAERAQIIEAAAVEPLEGAGLIAPMRPRKIVAIGLNYLDHIRETGLDRPGAPMIFAKFPSVVIGPGDPIEIDPELTSNVDWEVELGVVIGRRLKRVTQEDALDGVFGYTIANDLSARDVQFADQEWERGKNLDTFCPIGPVVVTADEIPDPQRLGVRTRVNGELVQDSSTAEMVFGVAEIISYCARHFTLEPGDLILTGTPHGCGYFMSPQRWLGPGDTVEVEIDRIGTLSNRVKIASSSDVAA